MKLLARMMALLSFFVMVQYANAASNSIYVDQIGDGANISITQTGSGNQIGTSTTRSSFNGNNNLINVQQIGNQNIQNMNVIGDGATITTTVTGNSNQIDLNCPNCNSANITKTITGNGNQVSMTNDGLTNTNLTIESDNNTVTMTNNTSAVSGVNNTINISGGNGNQVTLDQTGSAAADGHSVDLAITGAINTVSIGQGGTVDSKINATINGSSNALTIKSNHQ